MKKKIIITIIILVTTVLLGVGGYFIYALNQGTADIADTDAEFESTLMEAPTDGSTPKDHTLEENVAYALWVVSNTNEFYTVTEGTAQASVATQQIYNKRVVKDGKAMTTMISSGIVSTAKQKYFLKDKVLLRDATSINGNTATWVNSAPECVSYKTIKKRYGWLPQQATGYIICEDTYINKSEMKIIDNEDGTYKLCFDLDPDGNKAPFYYRREVLTNAGSSIIPEFYSIHFEMTINSNWQILVNDIQEQYKVKSKGIEAITKTDCHEQFFYSNVSFDEDSYNYFESYAYLSVLEDDSNEIITPDCLSIVVESLQQKDAKDIVLDLDIKAGGFKTTGVALLNISDLENIKVIAQFKELYVEYTDQIYISVGDTKVKVKVEDLEEAISKITSSLPSSDNGNSSIDVQAIMDDFAKSSMVEEDNLVKIDTNLHLMGFELPIHFEISHEDDNYSLLSASVNINVNNQDVNININKSSKKLEASSHDNYMELSKLEFLVDDVLDIIKNKNVDFEAELDYQGLNVNLIGKLSFEDKLRLDASLSISNGNETLSFDICFNEDVLYLSFENIKLMVDTNDLIRIAKKYGNINKEITIIQFADLNDILSFVLNVNFTDLIQDLVIEDDSLSVKLNLQAFTKKIDSIKLSLKNTDYGISGTVNVKDIEVLFKLGNLGYENKEINTNEYYRLKYLEGIVDEAIGLYKSKKIGFDLNFNYDSYNISGSGIIDFEENLNANVLVSICDDKNKLDLNVTYLSDIVYLDLGNIKLKVSKDDLLRIISKYSNKNTTSIDLSTEGIINVLFSIDFNKLIDEFVVEEDLVSIKLNLEDYIKTLNELKVKVQKKDGIDVSIQASRLSGNINIYKSEDAISVTGEYENLGYIDGFVSDFLALYSGKKLSFNADIEYDSLKAKFEGIIDFESKLKLNANLILNYDNKDFNVSVTYLDDVIYFVYGNVYLKLNVNDFITLANEYTDLKVSNLDLNISTIISVILSIDTDKLLNNLKLTDSVIDFELDLSYLLESIGKLKGTITRGDKLSIKLSMDKGIASVDIASTNLNVEFIDYDYYDLMELDNVFKKAFSLYKKGQMGFEINGNYKEINLSASGVVKFIDGISLKTSINVSLNNNNYLVDVIYKDDVLYLSLFDTKLKITKNDLSKLIAKYGKKESTNILDTIMSIDFEKLLEEVVISDGTLNVKANLNAIKESLGQLSLVLSTDDENVNLDATYLDLILGLKIYESTEEIGIIDDSSYYEFGYLEGILDDVISIVDSKKLSLDFNLSFKDILVNGKASIDFKDDIKAIALLKLNYKELNLNIKVTYISDKLYLDVEDIKLCISKADLEKMISKFGNNDNDTSLLDKVLSIDYNKLIEEILISENLVDLKLNLESLSDKISSVSATLKHEDNLCASISLSDILVDLVIKEENIIIEEPTGLYNNLGYLDGILDNVIAILDSKELAFNANLDYKGVKVNVDGLLSFSDDLNLMANINLSYDSNDLFINVYYYNESLYMDFDDMHLMVSKADLEEIIAMFTNRTDSNILDKVLSIDFDKLVEALSITSDNVTLDLDVSELVKTLSKISVVLNNVKDKISLDVSIKDLFDVSANVLSSNDQIILPNNDYQDLGRIKGLLKEVSNIITAKGLSSSISFKYDELTVLGDVVVKFNDSISLMANLDIKYKNLNEELKVYYFDTYLDKEKVILIDYRDNHLMIPLACFINENENVNLNKVFDVIFSVDFKKILVSLIITDNEINLTLDLSDYEKIKNFIDIKNDLNVRLLLDDDKIYLSTDIVDLECKLSNFEEEIEMPTFTYKDLSGMVNDIYSFVKVINNESFRLSLNGTFDIKSITLDISGYVDFILNNKKSYDIFGSVNLSSNNFILDLTFEVSDKMLYLNIGEISVGIDLSNASEFINDVMTSLNLGVSSIDTSKLENVLETLVIDNNLISVDLSSVVNVISNLTIALDYVSSKEVFNVYLNSDELKMDLKAEKIEAYNLSLPSKYLTNDDVLSLCKTVSRIIEIVKNNNYNLNFDVDVYKNSKKKFNISGNLGVKLDIPEDAKFNIDYLSFIANLVIVEYEESGKVKVIHRADITWVDDMVYLVYGNNESNLNSKIKFYATKESVLSTLASVTEVLGLKIDFLSQYLNADLSNVDFKQLTDLFTKYSKTYNLSSMIKDIDVLTDGFNLELYASILKDIIPDSKIIDVSLISNDSSPLYVTVSGLYTDYVNENEYTRIDVNSINLIKEDVVINSPSSLNGYINISNIDELVNGLLTTGSNKDYAIEGTVTLGLPVVNDINVPVDARVRVLEDGSPLVYVHLDFTNISGLVTLALEKKDVYFYYMDEYVYIYRVENGKNYKLKVTYTEFFDDIIYYLLDFSLGMPKIVLDKINTSKDSNDDYVIDAGTVLNSYSYGNHKFNLSINMEALTGNSNLGDMSLSLVLENMAVSKNQDGSVNTSYALTGITNFNFDLVSVITLESSKLALTNITNIDGYNWFTSVNMDDVLSYISNYSYGTDMIYENDSYVGKRSHTVTFVISHKENEYQTGQSGAVINFPKLDVIEDGGKYYVFNGWYKDKYLKEEYVGNSIPEENVSIYASWKEVNYYNLNIYSIDGNVSDRVYGGASLEKYLDKNVCSVDGISYIFKGYSKEDGGNIIDLDNMPENDLTLYAIWEEISYKLYIDGSYYSTLDSNTSLALNKDYYLVAGDLYYGFDKSLLTYDTLVLKYNTYAIVSDGIGYIYLVSDVYSLDGYYTINLDYNYNKFNDKLYKSVSLPIDMEFSSNYLPSAVYNNMSINYWYNDTNEYHYGNINEIERVNTSLKAYYATSNFLSYGIDNSSSKPLVSVTGFNYDLAEEVVIILPKYVLVNGSYEVLKGIAVFIDDEKYSVFTGNTKIKGIYFNDGFEFIGENAFKNCTELNTIYFSKTINSISKDAFYISVSTTFDTNADYAKKKSFYIEEGSSLNTSNLLACKWNEKEKYYGKEYKWSLTDWGDVDLRNSFKILNMALKDYINASI